MNPIHGVLQNNPLAAVLESSPSCSVHQDLFEPREDQTTTLWRPFFFGGGEGFPFKLKQPKKDALLFHCHWASETRVESRCWQRFA